ncbi:hypothetical protein HK101_011028 [Irineochytrium annulatum]|nr:hypothetical protein HK101_011028 [Irineochytrium annulatum]
MPEPGYPGGASLWSNPSAPARTASSNPGSMASGVTGTAVPRTSSILSHSGGGVEDWDSERLGTYLLQHGVPERVVTIFKSNQINGKTVFAVDHSVLRDDLGVSVLNERLLVINAIQGLKEHAHGGVGGVLAPAPASAGGEYCEPMPPSDM